MSAIFVAYNPLSRKHEEVDVDEMELVPGMQVVKMFWNSQHQRYMTVPGASRHVVTENFELVRVRD